MATIETLVEQIEDKALRYAVAREVGELKMRLDWGLVFERHLPSGVAPMRERAFGHSWRWRVMSPRTSKSAKGMSIASNGRSGQAASAA